jgi:L-erythro-3,5-diaminohexanoate dehydrogenase
MHSDPTGLHRVIEPAGVLPQAATRLDTRKDLWPDEVRVRVERLNLDAASFRQLQRTHVDGDAVRTAVLDIVASRGKMQNPITGSGGMLSSACWSGVPNMKNPPKERSMSQGMNTSLFVVGFR